MTDRQPTPEALARVDELALVWRQLDRTERALTLDDFAAASVKSIEAGHRLDAMKIEFAEQQRLLSIVSRWRRDYATWDKEVEDRTFRQIRYAAESFAAIQAAASVKRGFDAAIEKLRHHNRTLYGDAPQHLADWLDADNVRADALTSK